MMSNQKYKRTNFEEDEVSVGGTPPPGDLNASVIFKNSLSVCRKGRTTLECILFVLIGLFSIALIVMGSLLAIKGKQIDRMKGNGQGDEVCLMPECVTIAGSLLKAMDRSADPCVDFFQYACGGWIKSHVIPSGHSRWGTFGVLWQENQVIMRQVIERPLNSTNSTAEKKAMLYYQSCMDKNKTIEELGAKPLLQMLQSLGGWSISNSSGFWDVKTFDLQKTLQQMGISVLFSIWVAEDDKNSSANILQIDQAGLSLPEREYYLNKTISEDKVLTAFLEYMTRLGVLLGGEENNTREQMLEIIEFEVQLANITIPNEDRRSEEKLYHRMTVKDLQNMAPFINWLDMLNTLLSVTNQSFTESEEIVVYAPEYLQNMTVLLRDTMSTEEGNRTLRNYLIWHVAKTMAPYLSSPFRDARKILTEALSGTTGGEELWRYCISDTDDVMGFALGAMFVREAFTGDSKEKAEKMIQEVKTAFKKNLPSLSWMDDKTREAAVEKANAVIDLIGFPEYILNRTKLDKEYERLTINASEYFWNNVRNLQFVMMQNLEKLKQKPKANVWDMTPPTVNAYYTPTKNEIVFPAGILQAPFYDPYFPKSLNFGAMGVVMGHELTHGFDDQGREYDKFGNMRQWWNNASIEKFNDRAQCIIDQYSQYKLNGENIKGKQTLGENIADNGGLKAAYHAYEAWVQEYGEERPLPALNLTHRQLFFLGFSQVWCSTSTKEADHLQIVCDPHSPAKFRVIGTLSNSMEFAKLYNCAPGSPMNPVKKCEVW
ncbi:hypothetical protein ACJMK2_007225 [Sinanodonta woodiana]|uniref:Endothelin-converting enzyme 1 n=1 Tax=Sinanodonta woodiana TaxID=1069815 RepID=A0ABD3VL10_SINWO